MELSIHRVTMIEHGDAHQLQPTGTWVQRLYITDNKGSVITVLCFTDDPDALRIRRRGEG